MKLIKLQQQITTNFSAHSPTSTENPAPAPATTSTTREAAARKGKSDNWTRWATEPPEHAQLLADHPRLAGARPRAGGGRPTRRRPRPRWRWRRRWRRRPVADGGRRGGVLLRQLVAPGRRRRPC